MNDLITERKRAIWRKASLKYQKTSKGKISVSASQKASYKRDHEKHLARARLRDAVRRGKIIKPTVCSEQDNNCSGRLEAHHDDYEKPFEVKWLCIRHHTNLHLGGAL